MKTLAATLVLMLAGCAVKPWSHPTMTLGEQMRDERECWTFATARFQPTPQPAGPVYTTCNMVGHQAQCSSSSGLVMPDLTPLVQMAAAEDCMKAKGWRRE
jgi:hypothetical protein